MVGIKGKSGSGGQREGAGRPKGAKTTAISFRMDNDLVEYVNTKENKNRFINNCIREKKEREE